MQDIDLEVVVIRAMHDGLSSHLNDLRRMSEIHQDCFPTDCKTEDDSSRWIAASANAGPRMNYFVAEQGGELLGYILWMEKGGFREEAVLELEQIGVHTDYRRNGVGAKLITESLTTVAKAISADKRKLKLIEVTTNERYSVDGDMNHSAAALYERTLGASEATRIPDLFSFGNVEGPEELILIARAPAIAEKMPHLTPYLARVA